MSETEEPLDRLQGTWQQCDTRGEDLDRTAQQVLEQDRRYRNAVRRSDAVAAVAGLLFLPLLLLSSSTGRWPVLRAGYALMAIGCGITVTAIWLYHRWNREAPRRDLSVRDHLQQSVAFLERQATLLRATTLWCGLTLFLGGFLVGVGIWMHIDQLAGALIGAGSLLAWIGSWHMNNVRKVREIAERKSRIEDMLRRLSG